ncbi:amidase [Chitinasiproducens palmae]|uniref:Aspartyl-tRNA(Asn)/glutamyl-tRNA(Gln) amidotransferase subunit A n=1 Tax=Chitinasiproducens palmae TaxID=1770053 RepID=A0A1H2PUD7_9BURK|nr:amidase [Chitinasiproducens palmae]SDV50788.1 aspartyl-tRNA(Asn)/glutamyl-tRNA(Gln) amidotransferase subunit A [Chitinasiproducens palmae]
MIDTALYYLTVGDAGRAIRRGELSPVDLVDAYLARIESVDAALHSYLLVAGDRARDAARLAEAEQHAGRSRGPMHGIPYAAKDNYYTAGIRTCAGSRLMLDHVPSYDAAAIERMRAAGAILLGKLNTWEYGTGTGAVHFDLPYPPARNPWDTNRFTGGSSTGSGASVAAGTAMIALGSDTGGSVRLPAAACGLQGLKPTFGRISRHGMLPNCYSADVPGALAWTVEDSALVLEALAGHDARDPASAAQAVPSFTARLEDGVKDLVIGVVRDLGEDEAQLDAANRAGIEQMSRLLGAQGARLIDIALPVPPREYQKALRIMNWTESLSIHEADFLGRAHEMGQALRDKMMSGFMIRGVDYLAAQRRRRELTTAIDTVLRSLDALILPGAYHVAPPFSEPDRVLAYTSDSACPMFSISGHPAMSVCTGFDADGMPTNAQIAGKWFDEATVLRVARAYERETAWRDRRPAL